MMHWFRPDGSLSGETIAKEFADLLEHSIKQPAR